MKFKKDLLVSIPTLDAPSQITPKYKLDGPQRLDRTLEMVYDKCQSKDNFDLQVIINDHQVEIYQKIIDKWKIKPTIIKFVETWETLIKAQNDKMSKGDYYFFVFFPDDMYGLSENWDAQIISKKGIFKDDLFVLFSKYDGNGRDLKRIKDGYENPATAFKMFEQNPVWTYKFGEFTYKLFKEPYSYDKGREIIIAILINLLKESGHNRHVESEWKYTELVCNVNQRLSNFPMIENLISENCSDLRPIVKDMLRYIEDES